MNESAEQTAAEPAPAAPPPWDQLDDQALLGLRICDLPVRIEGSPLESRIARFHEELAARGLRFRPPVFLATEWLCPDLVPAIGIPFCLAHPRLQRLERSLMLEVEGEGEAECLQLLRHEAGHAFNYAYRFFRRTRWRDLFGAMSQPYRPHDYLTRPYSRQYVNHLRDYYAQAHPDEDFAETFAVWLTPGLDWREKYKDWGALRKLEYMDHLLRSVAERPPEVAGGPRHFAAAKTRMTLRTYYEKKRREFAKAYTGYYDPVLRDLFTAEAGPERADRFLNRHRRRLVDAVARWGRMPKYAADQLIRRLSRRAGELGLFLRAHDKEPLFTLGVCMAALAMEARARSPDTFRKEQPL